MFRSKYTCDICGKDNLKAEQVKMLCEDCQERELKPAQEIIDEVTKELKEKYEKQTGIKVI